MPPQQQTFTNVQPIQQTFTDVAPISGQSPASSSTPPAAPESTMSKIGRGATLGAFEGLGVNLATNPRDVVEGTFKNLGQGVKDLLVQTWEANTPKSQLGKALDDPISHTARTALDVIPTFIDQTARSLEQGGKDFYQAIQNKDWESAAQIAAKNAAMIATLKAAKEKGATAASANAVEDVSKVKPTMADRAQSLGRRVTEATQGAKDAVRQAIDKQTAAIDKGTQQAQAVARRGELAKTVDQQSIGLGKDINALENKVYQQANTNFDNVRAKIGNVSAPPDDLISTVKNAETNILQGIPENIKEFRSIVKLENTSPEMTKLRNDVMAGQGMQGMDYDSLSPDRKAVVDDIVERLGAPPAASQPLTWDKLQSLKSRLDSRLRDSRGMNGDLKRSLFAVRDGVVDEMGNMAQSAGAGPDWANARDFYKQWREDFHEPAGPGGSGSPVAQAKDAVDPNRIRQPFERTQSAIGNRGVDILNKYPQFGGDKIAQNVQTMLAHKQEMDALPKTVKNPIPPPPTVNLDEVARQRIEQTAQRVGRLNVWDARIVASSVIAGVLAPFIGVKGGVGLGASYVAMKELLARTLEKPKVVNWLAKTPPAELDALSKLPGIDKINVQHGLTEAAIELSKRRKFALDPSLSEFLGASNVARIAAVNSAVQAPKRKPGDQLKDLQQMTSNPAMPAGQEQ